MQQKLVWSALTIKKLPDDDIPIGKTLSLSLQKTMPFAAAAAVLQSALCFFSKSSSTPFNSQASSSDLDTQLAAKPESLLNRHPLYTPSHTELSLQFKEKILCLEIMGVDAGKALSQNPNPNLRFATLDSICSVISFLHSKGIHQKDLAKIFGMCPNILTSSIKSDLNPVFTFLSEDLKVPDYSFRKVINKCPRLLASRLGFKDLNALADHDSLLLVSNVERTLVPKLEYLEGLGFPREEAVGMVLRCPGLLTFSIDNNFKPKIEYFSVEMGKRLEDLKGFPQYFAFSLEKRIRPKHMEVVERGVEVPLPLMLKSTDEEFRELLRELGVGWDEMSIEHCSLYKVIQDV